MINEEENEKERRFQQLIHYSGLPLITRNSHLLMTFLPGSGTKKAYQSAIQFVAQKDGKPLREHHFITFVGEVGRGKTHLALGIGWQWLGQGMGTVKYWQVSELLDAMREEYDNRPEDDYGNPRKGQLDQCKECSLLILDDLGTEKTTEWVADKLDSLINHRWLEEKPTVFTTNMEPKQLLPRVRSRLKEGVVVTLEGEDYREYKAKLRRAAKAVDSSKAVAPKEVKSEQAEKH